ncbi:MAG: hypothetical protein Q8N89_04820 [Azonexus sp.]|nr:hypothetical protein [Azonexus sp.]
MRNQTTLAAILALPLLLLACDRAEQSPTAAVPNQEKQAMTPDKALESAPPAAGMPGVATEPSATPVPQSAVPSPDNSSPAAQPDGTKKAY